MKKVINKVTIADESVKCVLELYDNLSYVQNVTWQMFTLIGHKPSDRFVLPMAEVAPAIVGLLTYGPPINETAITREIEIEETMLNDAANTPEFYKELQELGMLYLQQKPTDPVKITAMVLALGNARFMSLGKFLAAERKTKAN